MILKNSNIIIKYLSKIYNYKQLTFNLLLQQLVKENFLKIFNNKNFCIYTYRYRSVFTSHKMSRYKLKEFLDNRTFSNIFVK